MTRSRVIPGDLAGALALAFEIDIARCEIARLSGGCIHPAARIRVSPDLDIFVKWREEPGRSGFAVEARGLAALRETGGLRVPEVLGYEPGSPERRGWLALEFIHPGRPTRRTSADLGTGLARLHRRMPDAAPGWGEDGFIGPLPQSNRERGAHWASFWRDARLESMWRVVAERFPDSARRDWIRVVEALPGLLGAAAPSGLSLLHGDLWSGNVLTDAAGSPVLIDPAVYVGDREVDLAMMELFGGFAAEVFAAYDAEDPIHPGYAEVRRDVYQLYPLLVHVRLFGQGYVDRVASRLRRILSSL